MLWCLHVSPKSTSARVQHVPVGKRHLEGTKVAAFPSPRAPHEDQPGSATDWRSPKSVDQGDDGRLPSEIGNRPRDTAEWTMVLRYDDLRSATVVVCSGYARSWNRLRSAALLDSARFCDFLMASCLSPTRKSRRHNQEDAWWRSSRWRPEPLPILRTGVSRRSRETAAISRSWTAARGCRAGRWQSALSAFQTVHGRHNPADHEVLSFALAGCGRRCAITFFWLLVVDTFYTLHLGSLQMADIFLARPQGLWASLRYPVCWGQRRVSSRHRDGVSNSRFSEQQ